MHAYTKAEVDEALEIAKKISEACDGKRADLILIALKTLAMTIDIQASEETMQREMR